ncbi:MAG: dihydrodipicolinate synthase family protein [Planctomycetota bacterium]|jgi:dihydrodipicolinate synthase/N-acetylneuraminate lyase
MSSDPPSPVEQVVGCIRPGRRIEGLSAVLLPCLPSAEPDYEGLAAHIVRTAKAGLVPAVNMDTGYVELLTPEQRERVLRTAVEALSGGTFVAGAYVEDGDGPLQDRYRREIEGIEALGGVPILFQCSGLNSLSPGEILALYREVASGSEQLIAFELGRQFAPFGCIYDLETVRGIMELESIVGIKHSSLDRSLEWQRIALRDQVRPEFRIYTGNDLAIDMVMYGSDYLLGLSTFCPEAFALRDRFWEEGDARFHQLNDLLQYLGSFAFRSPVPAYKHSAAQFLRLTGGIADDRPPAGAPRRPDSDLPILADIAERIAEWLDD